MRLLVATVGGSPSEARPKPLQAWGSELDKPTQLEPEAVRHKQERVPQMQAF